MVLTFSTTTLLNNPKCRSPPSIFCFQKTKYGGITMSNNNNQELIEITYNNEKIIISQEIADYLEDYRRDIHRQLKKKQRNQNNAQWIDGIIESLMSVPPVGFEDDVIRKLEQKLMQELVNTLPETQRRRLKAYYYDELTYREIATLEGVHFSAIKRSVELALKNLKRNFK